jgi:hypothetical protein
MRAIRFDIALIAFDLISPLSSVLVRIRLEALRGLDLAEDHEKNGLCHALD